MSYIFLKEGDVLQEGDEFSYHEKLDYVPDNIKQEAWFPVESIGSIIGQDTSPRAVYRRPI